MRHVPIGAAALGVHTSSLPSLPVMLPSPPALRHDGHLDSATALLRQSAPWLQRACVLCGYGDNSVQHWMSSCACLGVAGSLLLAFLIGFRKRTGPEPNLPGAMPCMQEPAP